MFDFEVKVSKEKENKKELKVVQPASVLANLWSWNKFIRDLYIMP